MNIHTVTDTETLVRTIIQLVVNAISATGVNHEFHMLIGIAPAGTKITAPVITQILDGDSPLTLLWEYSGAINVETVAGFAFPLVIDVDLKGMRKLKPGDLIFLRHICNVSSGMDVKGHITQFFKQ